MSDLLNIIQAPLARDALFPEIVWPPVGAQAVIRPQVNYGLEIVGLVRGKQRPRARRLSRGVQLYSPAETILAENWVRTCFVDIFGNPFLYGIFDTAVLVDIEIPKAWQRTKRAAAARGDIPCDRKPDVDNVAKLYLDALRGLLYADDAQVGSLVVEKRWGEKPRAEFCFRWRGPPPERAGRRALIEDADFRRLGLI